MNKILTASVALLALGGAAVAQEVPGFYGTAPSSLSQTVDVQTSQPVVAHDRGIVAQSATEGFNINASGNYSGK